jgi:prophage DNA circulation protein
MPTFIQHASPEPWRMELRPAKFSNAYFHVEHVSKTSGRRIALHEYPKRDLPYAEDMGQRVIQFDVLAYTVEWDRGQYMNRDYRIPRDELIIACESYGPATLVLPTLPEFYVVCERYSVSESRDKGGFALFEMRFTEYGLPGNQVSHTNTTSNVNNAANAGNAGSSSAFQNALNRWNARVPLQQASANFPPPPQVNPLDHFRNRLIHARARESRQLQYRHRGR